MARLLSILRCMNRHHHPSRQIRVALPIYGSRVLPRFCLARRFCVAHVDSTARTARVVDDRAWESTEAPSLPRWLKSLGVAGVVCGGIHPRHHVALENEGLWVAWGYRGEVDQVLADWLAGRPGDQREVHCLDPECVLPDEKEKRGEA